MVTYLDDQVEVTGILSIERGRGVFSLVFLSVDLGGETNVLTDGKSEDRVRQETGHVSYGMRDLEPVQRRVVRQMNLLNQLGVVKVRRGGQDGNCVRKVLLRGEDERQAETEGDDKYSDLDVQLRLDELKDGHVDAGDG